jgi:hypothetical protein
VLGIVTTLTVLLTFVFTALVDEPATAAAVVVVFVLSIGLNAGRKRRRPADQTAPEGSSLLRQG